MGKAEDKVLGVVHGVQPAIGAATAYKRVLAGFEVDGLFGAPVAGVLGWTGKHVTAVFANAPGALELLPNKLYPSGWLKISRAWRGTAPHDIAPLPKSDPYEEIYRVRDKWWRLMDPAWIDPAGVAEKKKSRDAWNTYLNNLSEAEFFHDTLGEYYHLSTWAHYGAAEKCSTWGQVRWSPPSSGLGYVSDADFVEARLKANNALGTLVLERNETRKSAYAAWWNMVIDPPEMPGDGTVPEVSGRAPQGKVRFVARMSGYDHQGSYAHPNVQSLTLYCVAKIAAESA